MTASWTTNELAIFSVSNFLFGVDTRQIQEIASLKPPELLTGPSENAPFIILRHHNQLIPVFHLYKKFHSTPSDSTTNNLSLMMTVVTFYRASYLMAYWVDTVETITTVSLRSLKAVPSIMTKAAQKISVWGFYEMSDRIIPLIDIRNIVTDQNVTEYTALVLKIRKNPDLWI